MNGKSENCTHRYAFTFTGYRSQKWVRNRGITYRETFLFYKHLGWIEFNTQSIQLLQVGNWSNACNRPAFFVRPNILSQTFFASNLTHAFRGLFSLYRPGLCVLNIDILRQYKCTKYSTWQLAMKRLAIRSRQGFLIWAGIAVLKGHCMRCPKHQKYELWPLGKNGPPPTYVIAP